MAEVNVIDWHIHPFKADGWYAAWLPALERCSGFGASEYTLTRSDDDPLHFRQTTVWENRSDFERYWSSSEISAARQEIMSWYNKPLLPTWHALITAA